MVESEGRETYTTGEIAKLLSMSAQTAIRVVDGGKVRSFRIGSFRRVSRGAVVEYLATQPEYLDCLERGDVRPRGFTGSEVASLAAEARAILDGKGVAS